MEVLPPRLSEDSLELRRMRRMELILENDHSLALIEAEAAAADRQNMQAAGWGREHSAAMSHYDSPYRTAHLLAEARVLLTAARDGDVATLNSTLSRGEVHPDIGLQMQPIPGTSQTESVGWDGGLGPSDPSTDKHFN